MANPSEDHSYRLSDNGSFQKLPKFLQESILQSGISVDSAQHLTQLCRNITGDTDE